MGSMDRIWGGEEGEGAHVVGGAQRKEVQEGQKFGPFGPKRPFC